MTYDMTAVQRQLEAGPQEAVDRWEQCYHQQVFAAAQAIAQNREKSPVVLLAGPSGSSKTTTATRITQALGQLGVRAHLISMDNYYLSRSDPAFPRQEDGSPDLESPLGLDIPLLNEHFALLETGGDIYVPIYDFPSHSRLEGRSLRMDASQGDVFLFEGIHALNDLFTAKHPKAYRVYVAPEDDFSKDGRPFCTPQDLRLMRRVVRDYLFRGASAQYSLQLWGNVLSSEQQYVLPFRDTADTCITTTLPYELGVLGAFAQPLLQELPQDVPCRDQVDRVLTLLQDVTPLPADLVPGPSILREFIGGGT
jgi:uridine kinase